jgi:glycosyltransferase involved in cell wall biosynthesis
MCLPSYSEGFSSALLEAAACDTYIVSNNVGVARQLIVSRQHGMLINRDSTRYTEQLRDALLDAFRNSEQLKQGGKLLREQALTLYTWENTADAVEEIFCK